MRLVIEITLSCCLVLAGYCVVCRYFRKGAADTGWKGFKPNSRQRILYLVAGILAFAVLTAVFGSIYREDGILHQVKLLFLAGFLFPIAAVDYREQKIPNKFLLAMLLVRVCLLAAELAYQFDSGVETLRSSLIGAAVIGLFFLLIRLVLRGGLGMGDVKLFAMMGFYQGLWGAVNSVFFSLLAAFVIAVGLLATHKKGAKDEIPFGPCILVGTIVAMGLSGM